MHCPGVVCGKDWGLRDGSSGDEVAEIGALLMDERLRTDVGLKIEILLQLADQVAAADNELATLHRLQRIMYAEPSASPTTEVRAGISYCFLECFRYGNELPKTP